MTIGIAASGPSAGAAVRDALLGAELLGRGSIKGFAVFTVFDPDGAPQWRSTQDGGLGTLALPESWASAQRAAVISSGPNRPEPLDQFLPAASGRGMVTGHRLPNSTTTDGQPLNEAVLRGMSEGSLSQDRLEELLCMTPELDAGIVALGADGTLALGNTERALRRNDLGSFLHCGPSGNIGILLNTIYCAQGDAMSLAHRLGGLALSRLEGRPGDIVHLAGPVPIRAAERDFARIDAQGTILEIGTSNPLTLHDTTRVTVLYSGADILGDEGRLGSAETEIFAAVRDGQVQPHAPVASRSAVVRRSCAPSKV
ncbi:DUF6963 family protein [Salipiger profundus]|uniref:DUF6963 family protein n=1 Tax=Salipiger profundus TaxID=1229727 RepID=UPI0008E2BC3C|nr:hypothetical protein [Salipiger profundus]SFD77713.1 hypothetical protein SAMN05444415_11729 [Salipiger profundus]